MGYVSQGAFHAYLAFFLVRSFPSLPKQRGLPPPRPEKLRRLAQGKGSGAKKLGSSLGEPSFSWEARCGSCFLFFWAGRSVFDTCLVLLFSDEPLTLLAHLILQDLEQPSYLVFDTPSIHKYIHMNKYITIYKTYVYK